MNRFGRKYTADWQNLPAFTLQAFFVILATGPLP